VEGESVARARVTSNAPTTPISSVFHGPSRVSYRSLRSYQCRFLRQSRPPVRLPVSFPFVQPADFPPGDRVLVLHFRRSGGSVPSCGRASRAHTCANVYMSNAEIEKVKQANRVLPGPRGRSGVSPRISRALFGATANAPLRFERNSRCETIRARVFCIIA